MVPMWRALTRTRRPTMLDEISEHLHNRLLKGEITEEQFNEALKELAEDC